MAAIVLPELQRAAVVATDRATTYAKTTTRNAISSAGLGKLGGAVGSVSTQQRSRLRSASGGAIGIIYVRGKTESRANQALLIYSQGGSIFPVSGKKWLAYPTRAVGKRAGQRKMTPELYVASGSPLGKLRFVPDKGNPNQAYLIAKRVSVSRRTGRAKAGAERTPRGSDRADSVIAFVLLRFTYRAQRFNQDAIMAEAAGRIPDFVGDYLASQGD